MHCARLLLPLLAVALLGTGFTRVRLSPSVVHVRWTVHYRDVVATTDKDVAATYESEANTKFFPLSGHAAAGESSQHVRIVVAGRTLFDRALTRDEERTLGGLYKPLQLEEDVPGAGARDLAGEGTSILQYRASPPGYRVVPAPTAPPSYVPSRHMGCDRRGSFELERVASRGDTTARLIQRGDLTTCVITWPNEATMEIRSGGRIAYRRHRTFTKREQLSLPDAAGALHVTDGPAFVDFEGTGSPSIVLTGSTGGVHCCYRTHVFYRRARSYGETARTWGNGASYPALVRDARSGEIVLGTSNDDFAWTYGYANAVEPLQIFAFEHGRFLNVTLGFPAIIGKQADAIWKHTRALLRARKTWDAQPGIIAYMSDMSQLGREAEAWRNLQSACIARDCPRYLHDARATLRWISSRSDSGRATR